jgi:hypothetical protein
MVLQMLAQRHYVTDIFKAVCYKHDVTADTVRKDLRWACTQVEKDFDSARAGEPIRVYEYIDNLAEMTGIAGAATPVIVNGEPLMGRDSVTGEEFPVLQADAQLLGVSLKARQAQLAFLGHRDSVKWKRSLAYQQGKLNEAKIALAEEQLRVAQQGRELEEARNALLANRSQRGMLSLQEPDRELYANLGRFLTLGRVQHEEWIFRHSRRGKQDGANVIEGHVVGDADEHRDKLPDHGGDAGDLGSGGSNGSGGNGRGS